MKQLFAASLAALAVSSAMAQSYSDTAQVLSAQPIYERNSTPRQQCSNETVTTDRRVPSQGYVETGYVQPAPSGERTVGAGTVLGAIIGGVVGHQFGRSSGGRDVGTGVGVVAGGLIGNQIENSPRSGREQVDPQASVQKQGGNVGGVNQVLQVVAGQRNLFQFYFHLLIQSLCLV